eukprot:COSAG02_NODE_2562_length_8527_cov_24.422995_2_plen_277_part_00
MSPCASSCATVMTIWRILGSAEPVPPVQLQLIGMYASVVSTSIFMLTANCDRHDPESFEVSYKLLQFDLLWVFISGVDALLLFVSSSIRIIAIPLTLTAGILAAFHAFVIMKTAVMELYGEFALTMRQIRNNEPLRPGQNVYLESEPYRKKRNGGSGVLLDKADPDDKTTNPGKNNWRVQYPTGEEVWRDDLLHHCDDWALTAAWLIVFGVTFYCAWLLVDNISGARPLPLVGGQSSKASWSSLGMPEATVSATAAIGEPLWDEDEDEDDFSDISL